MSMMLPIPLDITALATISKMKYILITEVERLGLEPKLWATYINSHKNILPLFCKLVKLNTNKEWTGGK